MFVFGEKLKELRIEKNMTQDELGRIFEPNLAQSTIGTYEKGLREMSYNNLIRVSEYFNVSIDYLLGIEKEKQSISKYLEENNKKSNDIINFLEKENVQYKELQLRKNEKNMLKRIIEAIFEQ